MSASKLPPPRIREKFSWRNTLNPSASVRTSSAVIWASRPKESMLLFVGSAPLLWTPPCDWPGI